MLLGVVLIAVTGIYYLAFLLSMLAICAVVSAIARRRPGRLLIALPFAAIGLLTSFLANLPTLLFRWNHAPNRLGVPDRVVGAAEAYPLRLVELLSPVTAHRFGPFAALADHLYEPGREGFGNRAAGPRRRDRLRLRGHDGPRARCAAPNAAVGRWSRASASSSSPRCCSAMKGGVSRALEFMGLQGVRAWSRIAIVVAFASIVVFARLLDRLRVVIRRRHWRDPASCTRRSS